MGIYSHGGLGWRNDAMVSLWRQGYGKFVIGALFLSTLFTSTTSAFSEETVNQIRYNPHKLRTVRIFCPHSIFVINF